MLYGSLHGFHVRLKIRHSHCKHAVSYILQHPQYLLPKMDANYVFTTFGRSGLFYTARRYKQSRFLVLYKWLQEQQRRLCSRREIYVLTNLPGTHFINVLTIVLNVVAHCRRTYLSTN